MTDYLLFANKIIKLGSFFKFQFIKLGRQTAILFKRRKKLKKISLDYYKNWRFDKAYLLIHLKFKNAVWFKVGNLKGYDFSKPIVLNLHHFTGDTLKLEVFGLFQKQIYEINIKKQEKIYTASFKFRINKFRNLTTNVKEIAITQSKAAITNPGIKVSHHAVQVKQQQIQVTQSSYTQNEFL